MKKITLATSLALLISADIAYADSTFADLNYQVKQGDTTDGIGIGIYQLKDQGTGYYLSGTIGLPPDGYSAYGYSYSSYTERARVPYIANVGATFAAVGPGSLVPFYKTIHSYVGIGYGTLEGVAKYGQSWYDLDSYTKNGVNLNGGFILGFDSFGINLGVNSLSKTVYIGIGMITDKK
jgi:hypothetical protein